MTRVKRGNIARKRRKKILKLAKGFRGSHSTLFSTAKQQVLKALRYSYVGRKNRKRDYRRLWIIRIGAATRLNGVSYSQFMGDLKKVRIALNRKILAQLSILDDQFFYAVVKLSRNHISAS
uniref:Large ribosomal subunit protein bL20c n=1 Tax=Melanthalia intermedia TaxID=172989 RepID=A0A345UAS8_9FLOR|nr:ribosomal protein L20 [Melanthalia intermedia]AXI97564.1 ribosomal protein L20 [Melanthalia intermedia]